MSEPTPLLQALFFELFEGLPHQGPGGRTWTERALRACGDLPPAPRVVDLGCGAGAQTLDLAALTAGRLVALDLHAPLLHRLRRAVAERNLRARVLPAVGDMGRPPLAPGSIDLVWSEGALYSIGLEPALELALRLLRPGGHLVFTEPVWRTSDPPDEVRAVFEAEYPAMGSVADALSLVRRAGFELRSHFPLPEAAWWSEFYAPMVAALAEMRARNADDPEALAALDELDREPELHRRHGSSYGYEFVVCRAPRDA